MLLGCSGTNSPNAPPRVVFDVDGQGVGLVEVRGLEASRVRGLARQLDREGWIERFPVYTGETLPAVGDQRPALLGDWRVAGGTVRFEPRFPLVPEQSYVAAWRQGSAVLAQASFALPAAVGDSQTVVEAVYPSADVLPENLLRLYVQFSSSMSRGEAARRIKLFDGTGAEVPTPFVAPQQELWNPATDRLTLLFDPGRIKRGVGPNEELGSILKSGQSYRLVVADDWLDGRGRPLLEAFEKTFRVGPPDRRSPSPRDWQLQVPSDPEADLVVRFPEPLDHALLRRMLRVETAAGELVGGEVHIEPGESGWRFAAHPRWQPGEYRVLVDPALEDLAGNSPRRLFDARPDRSPSAPVEPLVLAFRISADS